MRYLVVIDYLNGDSIDKYFSTMKECEKFVKNINTKDAEVTVMLIGADNYAYYSVDWEDRKLIA